MNENSITYKLLNGLFRICLLTSIASTLAFSSSFTYLAIAENESSSGVEKIQNVLKPNPWLVQLILIGSISGTIGFGTLNLFYKLANDE